LIPRITLTIQEIRNRSTIESKKKKKKKKRNRSTIAQKPIQMNAILSHKENQKTLIAQNP
jgi:hypothetical protein